MERKGLYHELIENEEDRRLMEQEDLIFDVSQLLWEILEESGISRAELARRLGTSKSYITKLLRGYSNLTLRSLADIFSALGKQVIIKAAPRGCINTAFIVSRKWELGALDNTAPESEGEVVDELIEATGLQGAA